ncbi:MAG: hypothetical protein JOZ08_25885 [Verrucomicrobia bacterium]|nr:hypothetical protein [Verrucomicrobiota bacterium]MBV8278350.1 hypothetical protein [Verrucomicrobiota bacterium]
MPNISNHEFKVVIDGFDLPDELASRINKAVQRAVLEELASADLGGKDVVFTPVMGQMLSEDVAKAMREPGGSTGGIWIRDAVSS